MIVEGILEISDKGHGFLRHPTQYYKYKAKDPFVSRNLIKKYSLRNGLAIRAEYDKVRGQNPQVSQLISLNGCTPDEYIDAVDFDDLVAVDPKEQIVLETGAEPMGMRVMDLLTPIGKGQRGLLVAPPRTGKTVLLKDIANAISVNHPEIELMMLLVDERPEEVTDRTRSTKAEVIAS